MISGPGRRRRCADDSSRHPHRCPGPQFCRRGAESVSLGTRFGYTALPPLVRRARATCSEQELPDGGRAAVLAEEARAGADEVRAGGVVLAEERGLGRDEGEVEVHELLRVEELERLLVEARPAAQ